MERILNKLEPIGCVDLNKKIHIYGAGIAGLLIGFYLKKAGRDFVIYEKDNCVGGKIKTNQCNNGIAEAAANAVYTNEDVEQLIKELGLKAIYATEKLKKVVFRKQKPMSPPLNIFEIIKLFFNSLKKIKLTKPFSEYTSKQFFTPMLGENLVDEVMSAVYRGIYSIEADEIHAASLYPHPRPRERYLFYFIRAMKERKNGSKAKPKSVSFKGGMKDFITALEQKLKGHILLNSNETLKDNAIICTESFHAKELIASKMPELAQELSKIEYTHIETTTVFSKNQIPFLNRSFGILFPSKSKNLIMGILANNNIFPGRSIKENIHSYTFITQPQANIRDEFKKLGYKIEIEEKNKTMWNKAIPKYNITRYKVVSKTLELLKPQNNLMIFGNYTNGVSIREMLSFAKNFANQSSNQE